MDPARLARLIPRFGREAVGADSPLYARLSELVADAPELLALAAGSREATPMVFLAAVHDELLRDPDHELAAYYPTHRRRRAPDAGAARRARARSAPTRDDRLAATLATRRTQTNETARCAGLLPAFAAVAGGRPLAQIEIGASAGLNGLWDHYAYDYAGRPAGDASLAAADRLRAARAARAAARPAAGGVAAPASTSRPSTCATPATCAGCARACGPTSPRATRGSTAALAVAREHGPVDVRRGDALALLPALIEEAPAGALVCVFHTAALAYFTPRADRGRCARCSRASSATSPGSAASRPACCVGDRRAPGAPLHFALSAGRPGALAQVGRMGHHGGWLEWLG